MRKNELRNIKLNELDIDNNQINLKYTKTNKHRTVYFGNETKAAIINYLKEIEPNKYLIECVTEKKQMASDSLDKVIRKIKRKLNLPNDVSISFHKFRHTYATNYLENGANIEFVRETLGHAKITTTQIYLHLSNEHLQKQHNEYSPLNKIKASI
ncbi:tyrosine-type recombinase/integrase [Mycoplasmatota bacterium zrk1]